MPTAISSLVAPNSVRVWRGFRLPALGVDEFFSKLGTVFIPATVKMQVDVGLNAYLPTVPSGLADKPDTVPDETAILFWESPQTYWNGFTRLAVRTYTLTHGGVYVTQNNQSRADFPLKFTGTLNLDQPVFLFDKHADWMLGSVGHLVAARPTNVNSDAFRALIAQVLTDIQRLTTIDGAIACVGGDYVVYWELACIATGPVSPTTGTSLLAEALAGWKYSFKAAPTFLPVGLWDEWSGMDVRAGNSFNMQFARRAPP
jgi:hypothetical protein